LPLCASTVLEPASAGRFPRLQEMVALFRKRHPELTSHVAPTDQGFIGYKGRRLLSILNKHKLQKVLAYMLDEDEFLGPYGIRSLSRYHLEHPFTFWVGPHEYKVQYLPAESNTGMFGGNSNWRGPVWMPVNTLVIRALLNLYAFYGDDFKVECPTRSGQYMTLFEVGKEISRRLAATFLRDANGQRPVYGGTAKFQQDPHWRDLILFYEYFHGDNGAGLGASHQTGWTGLIAPLLDIFGRIDAKILLETERELLRARVTREQVAGQQQIAT
jgi:Mannosylglycerate hydrolase MGH1-like glycoside hydrolase domain